jgi:hypothetical protein
VDAGVHAASPADAEIAADSEAGPPSAGEHGGDAGDVGRELDAASNDARIPVTREDAQVPDATDAGDLCAADAGADITWHRDADEDGFGSDHVTRSGCPRPSGAWVTRGGDCDDHNPNVYPMQRAFFGTPYEAGGGDSFDYDCSGLEEGNPRQVASFGCGLLDLAVCTGDGYARTQRTGPWLNGTCGSTVYVNCQSVVLGALVCESTTSIAEKPYGCH